MIVAPTVVPPITPWSRSVLVQGQQPGATVRILADGSPVGSAQVDSGGEFVPLDAGIALKPGQRISATQTAQDGTTSEPAADTSTVVVLAEPTKALLSTISSPVPLMHCGTCLWLVGTVPGADVTVTRSGQPPVTVNARWIGTKVTVAGIVGGETVSVRQGRGSVLGWTVSLPRALGMYRPELPPPVVGEPLIACQKTLELSSLMPGATIEVTRDSGKTNFCFGCAEGRAKLAVPLADDEELIVRQTYPACDDHPGKPATYRVSQAVAAAPWFAAPVCAGDRDVELLGVHEGAAVRFLLGDSGGTVDATAGPPPHRFNLPHLGNIGPMLGVRQRLCVDGEWSDTTWTRLVQVGSLDEPRIVEPVHECGAAVCVEGLTAGTRVHVISAKWGGPIGDAVSVGDTFTDVRLHFALTPGDELSLELIRCGQRRTVPATAAVKPAQEILPPPVIVEPADDAGQTIAVADLVPGSWCDIERLDSPDQVQGVLVSSHPVTRVSSSVPVPKLAPDTLVRARQRLCDRQSQPGAIVKITDATPSYVSGSADRIRQLTGVDTVHIGLTGTDLGVPVWHLGRLFLFFGDCSEYDEDDKFVAADSDPIAWTTDPPDEPGGPVLHWVTHTNGLLFRLHVDGLPHLTNFEVPTGAFSYGGRLYVFIARYEQGDRMHDSHLAVTKQPNNSPHETLEEVCQVSSTRLAGWPAGRWLTQVAPTVVSCADFPGLPVPAGDGLVMFGTSVYHASEVFLAFCPLGSGPSPIPDPSTWLYFVDGAPADADGPANWRSASVLERDKREPSAVIPFVGAQGEVSVTWHPRLRRWVHSTLGPASPGVQFEQIHVRTARMPWGPWSAHAVVFDPEDPGASADNLTNRFVGLPTKTPPPPRTNLYAPYMIPVWTRFDGSTRIFTLYYTASTIDPPYNSQLLSARVHLGPTTL